MMVYSTIRRSGRAMLVALMAMACALAFQATQVQAFPIPQPQASLGGEVTNEATDQPVSGVTVELVRKGVVVNSDTTDAQGHFGFPDIAPGPYEIRVELGESRRISLGSFAMFIELTTTHK